MKNLVRYLMIAIVGLGIAGSLQADTLKFLNTTVTTKNLYFKVNLVDGLVQQAVDPKTTLELVVTPHIIKEIYLKTADGYVAIDAGYKVYKLGHNTYFVLTDDALFSASREQNKEVRTILNITTVQTVKWPSLHAPQSTLEVQLGEKQQSKGTLEQLIAKLYKKPTTTTSRHEPYANFSQSQEHADKEAALPGAKLAIRNYTKFPLKPIVQELNNKSEVPANGSLAQFNLADERQGNEFALLRLQDGKVVVTAKRIGKDVTLTIFNNNIVPQQKITETFPVKEDIKGSYLFLDFEQHGDQFTLQSNENVVRTR